MENVTRNNSETTDQKNYLQNENLNWPEVINNVVNNMTDKNMEVTYDFDNLRINLPEVKGLDGMLVGSAKCEINGRCLISTKLQNSNG
ncbi:MAG: hypothetical protein ACP5OH_06535 [Nitrososphaerota archaeon]